MFSWEPLSDAAAKALGERVLAASPVSPQAARTPGRGAWDHAPLAGAEVRLLVVTAARVVVFGLDRDPGGSRYYRLLRIETQRPRSEVAGVELERTLLGWRFAVRLPDRTSWDLEVSATHARLWRPVVAELGQLTGDDPVRVVPGPTG